MNYLLIRDLQLALADLLDNPDRFDAIKDTATFKIYGTELVQRRHAIDVLQTDERRDALGRAFYYMLLAILAHPDTTAEQRAVAQQAQQTLVPDLNLLRAKHQGEEAPTRKKKKRQLPELPPELATMPTPHGDTAADWAESFVQEGEKLGQLLSDNVLTEANKESAGNAALLRSGSIGLLSEMRQSLAAEVRNNSELPRDLIAIVFGYFDQLNDFRTKEPAGEQPPEPPPVKPPEPVEQ